MRIEHPDFSVVVKNRGRPPASWIWEIYRSGCSHPIKRSEIEFSTRSHADREGTQALVRLLSEYYN